MDFKKFIFWGGGGKAHLEKIYILNFFVNPSLINFLKGIESDLKAPTSYFLLPSS